ncbi:MAG: tyrosine-type recombinase/integrase [Cyclobacteriaceae bacterium]|nr:tyrosine-type recombinase/integrase [Cyclobacteriaceae bacterium]
MRCWYIPNRKELFREARRVLEPHAYVDFSGLFKKEPESGPEKQVKKKIVLHELTGEQKAALEKYKIYLSTLRYSERTIESYCNGLKVFFSFIGAKPLTEISNDDLVNFNNGYILLNEYSISYQNTVINAIKTFFRKIERSRLNPEIVQRPRRESKLPNVLSKEEVRSILEVIGNVKHRAVISLIYACGLRRSEALSLELTHVDYHRKLLIIKAAKGRKDRVVPLSDKLLELIRDYIVCFKPLKYVFEGEIRGKMYSATSLQNVLKQSVEKAGINKPVTLHWLRHSYATHLLEGGTDLRYIQEILGHKSSRTTEIYTHVSTQSLQKIRSPFDDL